MITLSIDLSDLKGIKKIENNTDLSIEGIDKTINVDCKAPVMLAKICIPYMDYK